MVHVPKPGACLGHEVEGASLVYLICCSLDWTGRVSSEHGTRLRGQVRCHAWKTGVLVVRGVSWVTGGGARWLGRR
jgi:hypothetical protein